MKSLFLSLFGSLYFASISFAQVYDGLPGRVDRLNPNSVITVLPGAVHNIAEGDIFHLPAGAIKRRLEGRLDSPLQLNNTPKLVARVNPQARLYCTRAEAPTTVFENRGTVKAVFEYPLPASPPGCQGLQCLMNWPTASVTKTTAAGSVTTFGPSNFELMGNALIYSFNVGVVPTDTVDLIVSHQYGSVNFNPGNFNGYYWKIGLVADMNCP